MASTLQNRRRSNFKNQPQKQPLPPFLLLLLFLLFFLPSFSLGQILFDETWLYYFSPDTTTQSALFTSFPVVGPNNPNGWTVLQEIGGVELFQDYGRPPGIQGRVDLIGSWPSPTTTPPNEIESGVFTIPAFQSIDITIYYGIFAEVQFKFDLVDDTTGISFWSFNSVSPEMCPTAATGADFTVGPLIDTSIPVGTISRNVKWQMSSTASCNTNLCGGGYCHGTVLGEIIVSITPSTSPSTSFSATPTSSTSASLTSTPSPTTTTSITPSSSTSLSNSISFSVTPSLTTSATSSITATISATSSTSLSSSVTPSVSSSPSFSSSPSVTPSFSSSASVTLTASSSASASVSRTSSASPSSTASNSASSTASPTTSRTPSSSNSVSLTPSTSPSSSVSPSSSSTLSKTPTMTITPSSSSTTSKTPSFTPTNSLTGSTSLTSIPSRSRQKKTKTRSRSPSPSPSKSKSKRCEEIENGLLCEIRDDRLVVPIHNLDSKDGKGRGGGGREGGDETIGKVIVPAGLFPANWSISVTSNPIFPKGTTFDGCVADHFKASISFDVTLYDDQGQEQSVKDLTKSILLSILANVGAGDLNTLGPCFGYLETGSTDWDCLEDFELKPGQSPGDILGTSGTDHLTTFAILLANLEPTNACGFPWWAHVIVLGIMVIFCVVSVPLVLYVPIVRRWFYGYKGQSISEVVARLERTPTVEMSNNSSRTLRSTISFSSRR